MNLQQDYIEQYSLKPTCLVGCKQNHAGTVIEHISPHQVRWWFIRQQLWDFLMFSIGFSCMTFLLGEMANSSQLYEVN